MDGVSTLPAMLPISAVKRSNIVLFLKHFYSLGGGTNFYNVLHAEVSF